MTVSTFEQAWSASDDSMVVTGNIVADSQLGGGGSQGGGVAAVILTMLAAGIAVAIVVVRRRGIRNPAPAPVWSGTSQPSADQPWMSNPTQQWPAPPPPPPPRVDPDCPVLAVRPGPKRRIPGRRRVIPGAVFRISGTRLVGLSGELRRGRRWRRSGHRGADNAADGAEVDLEGPDSQPLAGEDLPGPLPGQFNRPGRPGMVVEQKLT